MSNWYLSDSLEASCRRARRAEATAKSRRIQVSLKEARDAVNSVYLREVTDGGIDILSGTLTGGHAAAKTNKARYGADYYARIGAIGGSRGTTGGFYANRELASIAGRLGGVMSRRGQNKLSSQERQRIRLKYEREYAKALKELTAIHEAANKKRRLDEGAVTVYTRERGLVHS